jgi:RimJ/RimL family protein N-acetyltransferase
MQETKNKVYLRRLANDDLDRLLNWRNDAELYSMRGGHFRYVRREAETKWLRRRLEARDEVNLAICLSEPPDHIGNIYLPNCTHLLRNGNIAERVMVPPRFG